MTAPVATLGMNQWDNLKFRKRLLFQHFHISKFLEKGYMRIARRYNYVQANQRLLKADQYLKRGDLLLSWDDERIQRWCDARAAEVAHVVATWSTEAAAVEKVRSILDTYEIQFPDQQADLFGYGPALRRCCCERWWLRQVRRLQARALDELARSWRMVHDGSEIYCSDLAYRLRVGQKARNSRILNQLKATNDYGQEFLLSQLADLQVSNPKVRRSELMVRMRGFEELAKSQGRVGEFYTITCPSKYHSTNRGGVPNAKWNGSTVREAHQYLVAVWGRIRAALDRRGIDVYGFRVVEPHSDGCPHWHALLFVSADRVDECRAVFQSYSLAEDGAEPGARDNRFKAVSIDPARGTATGYIAKYISKNIDGHGISDDLYGHEAKTSAARIEAWAGTHGIRQFQQIGGPSVTVWRELRRLENPESDEVIERLRVAADSADWAAFCLLQGSGRGQTLALARLIDADPQTGECLDQVYTRYGEPALGRIVGLIGQGTAVITRWLRWTIERVSQSVQSVKSGPVSGFGLIPGWVLGGAPPGAPSWSSVNNCTG